MNSAILKLALATVALLISATVLAQKSAQEHVDDALLNTRVKLELMESSIGDATDIDVSTFRGLVQLSGFVDDEAAIRNAVRITEGVDGVSAVSNHLKIKSGKRTPGRALDDAIIAAKVELKLFEDSETSAHRINVAVRSGVVELSGFAETYAERNKAVEIAKDIEGVADVINSIDIAPMSPLMTT